MSQYSASDLLDKAADIIRNTMVLLFVASGAQTTDEKVLVAKAFVNGLRRMADGVEEEITLAVAKETDDKSK